MPKTQLLTIDKQLSGIANNFAEIAKMLVFDDICDLADEGTVKQQTYAGIYKIDIQTAGDHKTFDNWSSWFVKEWTDDKYRRKFVPNPKKVRLKAHKQLFPWMPLYIGKSKDIAHRVSQHINLDLDRPTTAMKIKQRSNMRDQRFRLSTIRLDVENYNLIVPYLESEIRNHYNPILGRQ